MHLQGEQSSCKRCAFYAIKDHQTNSTEINASAHGIWSAIIKNMHVDGARESWGTTSVKGSISSRDGGRQGEGGHLAAQ